MGPILGGHYLLLVDSREGSKNLLAPLQRLQLPADITTLEFGDIAFEGRGDNCSTLDIGIEYKQLDELLQSLRSGRLEGYQLPGMRKLYDDWCWLLVEGEYRVDKQGLLCTKTRRGWVPMHCRWTYSEFQKRLLTLELCGGCRVVHTRTQADSVRWIAVLYRWFTDTSLDNHSSHLVPYSPPALVALSQFRETVRTLPDVGLKFSLAAQRKFRSIRRAINASSRDWAELLSVDKDGRTRRLGDSSASKVIHVINHEEG